MPPGGNRIRIRIPKLTTPKMKINGRTQVHLTHYLISEKILVLSHVTQDFGVAVDREGNGDAVGVDEDTGHKDLDGSRFRKVVERAAGQISLWMYRY